MTTIQLACLDMAGTTVTDGGAVMTAFDTALATIGIHAGTPEHQQAIDYTLATMGQSKIEVLRVITSDDEDRAQQGNRAFETAYRRALEEGGAAPLPGAVETIRGLREQGVRVALTTGFSPTTRDTLLDALGWTDLVDLVLSPADAGRGRPHPDMVLTAVLRLGIEDVRAVAVVGDTVSDLWAGTRAGAGVVAGVLTGTHGRDDFATAPHTHVLDSVADLPQLLTATPVAV